MEKGSFLFEMKYLYVLETALNLACASGVTFFTEQIEISQGRKRFNLNIRFFSESRSGTEQSKCAQKTRA